MSFPSTRESADSPVCPTGPLLVDAGITTENVEEIFGTLASRATVKSIQWVDYVYHSLGKDPSTRRHTVETEDLRIEVVSMLGTASPPAADQAIGRRIDGRG